jgi:hypothetical protein
MVAFLRALAESLANAPQGAELLALLPGTGGRACAQCPSREQATVLSVSDIPPLLRAPEPGGVG